MVQRVVTHLTAKLQLPTDNFLRLAAFQGISNHYKVELPVSEIAYIYDYINMNSKNKGAGSKSGTSGQEDE